MCPDNAGRVASQARHRPLFHGTCVTPSGLLLSTAGVIRCICCHTIGVSNLALRTFSYPSFSVGLQPIDIVKTWPHFGHIISHNYDDLDDLCAKKTSLIRQVNTILCTFRNVYCLTKARLVKSYCTSFYGAEIWDHKGIEAIYVAWRKDIRRIWLLPNNTLSVLIPELCETLPLVDMFYNYMLNVVYRCLNNKSSVHKFVVRCGILTGQMDSVVGRNVLNCSLRYNTKVDRISKLEFGIVRYRRWQVRS